MFRSPELTMFILVIHLILAFLFAVSLIPFTRKLRIGMISKLSAFMLLFLSVTVLFVGLKFWIAQIYFPNILLLLFSSFVSNSTLGYLFYAMYWGKRIKSRSLSILLCLILSLDFFIFLFAGYFPKAWGVALFTVKDTFTSAAKFDSYAQKRVFGQKYANIEVEDYRVYRNGSTGTCAGVLEDFVETTNNTVILENRIVRSELLFRVKDGINIENISLVSIPKKNFLGINSGKNIEANKLADDLTNYTYDRFSRSYSTSRSANYSVLFLEGKDEDKAICLFNMYGNIDILLELLRKSSNF